MRTADATKTVGRKGKQKETRTTTATKTKTQENKYYKRKQYKKRINETPKKC